MKDFSIPMALLDYIPVVLFAFAAIMLQRDLYDKMSKGAFALFAAGTINVVFAGFSKATYKLLYAAGVCDYQSLSNLYFPVISVGFLLAGIALVAMLVHNQTENAALSVGAPVVFKGTAIMISFMVIGLGMIYVVLGIIAYRLKKPLIIAVLIASYVCSLMMGYLSSKDFNSSVWNWIAEATNLVAQGTFLLSVIMLHKAGLMKYIIER